jgi:hypothetical protein
MGRIRSGASRDVVTDLAIGLRRWTAIDQIGACKTTDVQRERIKVILISYANEFDRQQKAPTFTVVSIPLRRIATAAAKFKRALDGLHSPTPAILNAVRRMRLRHDGQEPVDLAPLPG